MSANMSTSMSIVLHLDKYCVYTHSIDGDVFYVGKGTGVRPFSHLLRNREWNALAHGAGKVEVNIVEWYNHEREAYETERRLIRELKPIANLTGGGGGTVGRSSKTLINKGRGRYVPNVLNVGRLTHHGHIRGLDVFSAILRVHLGVAMDDPGWEIPEPWAKAYDEYFHQPDPVYRRLSAKNKAK